MNWALSVVERLALTLILGAGGFIVASVRPALAKAEQSNLPAHMVLLVEDVRVSVWLAYNRASIVAGLVLVGVGLVRAMLGQPRWYIEAGGGALLSLLMYRKDQIDQQLKALYDEASDPSTVAGSPEYNANVNQVVQLTVGTLIGAGLLTAWTAREATQES